MKQPNTHIILPGFTLDVQFDCVDCAGGTVVRQPDGVEAHFNNAECLGHLLEGMVGRRNWQAHGSQIEAQIRTTLCLLS